MDCTLWLCPGRCGRLGRWAEVTQSPAASLQEVAGGGPLACEEGRPAPWWRISRRALLPCRAETDIPCGLRPVRGCSFSAGRCCPSGGEIRPPFGRLVRSESGCLRKVKGERRGRKKVRSSGQGGGPWRQLPSTAFSQSCPMTKWPDGVGQRGRLAFSD